jgi:hypothetical protein
MMAAILGDHTDSGFRKAHDAMPPSRSARLEDQACADIVASILEVNGLPAESGELPVDAVQMDAMVISTSGAQP